MDREAAVDETRQMDVAKLQAFCAVHSQDRYRVYVQWTFVAAIAHFDELVEVRHERGDASVREQRRTGTDKLEQSRH